MANKKDKYPRIKQRQAFGAKRGTCKICGQPSKGRVDVQVNIFRGDDDVHKVCYVCHKMYTNFGLLVKLGYKERKKEAIR